MVLSVEVLRADVDAEADRGRAAADEDDLGGLREVCVPRW
jgi:hypothetical protein